MSSMPSRLSVAALASIGVAWDPSLAAAQPSGELVVLASAPATHDAASAITRAIGAAATSLEREHVIGDIYHVSFELRIGSGPNAAVGLHRITREDGSGWPQRSHGAVLLLHGDFSSFLSNFALGLAGNSSEPELPSIAIWLAQRGFEVWGLDQRWALTPADGDLSDFGSLSFAQEVEDVERALAVARSVRALTGGGPGPLHLLGFSRGGFLAYTSAVADAARPPHARQIRSLVPLDIWAEIPPEDAAAREFTCQSAAAERDALNEGFVDIDNSFFITLGQLAPTAPDEPSPLFEGYTNRGLFLLTAAQTYVFFPPTDTYHLSAADILAGVPTGLSESSEGVIARWFAQATPHQSMRESADSDGIWCADGNGPPAPDLSRIEVPLFYLGAAGGYGEHGIYSTTRVGSPDVTTLVVRRKPPERSAEDFGHGDLLFARDAPALAWEPLASWLLEH